MRLARRLQGLPLRSQRWCSHAVQGAPPTMARALADRRTGACGVGIPSSPRRRSRPLDEASLERGDCATYPPGRARYGTVQYGAEWHADNRVTPVCSESFLQQCRRSAAWQAGPVPNNNVSAARDVPVRCHWVGPSGPRLRGLQKIPRLRNADAEGLSKSKGTGGGKRARSDGQVAFPDG